MDDLPHQIRERANGSCEFISPVGRLARIFAEDGYSKIHTLHFARAQGDKFAQEIIEASGRAYNPRIGFAAHAHERGPDVAALKLSSGRNWPTITDSANRRAPDGFHLSVGMWIRCAGISLAGAGGVVLLRIDGVQVVNAPVMGNLQFDRIENGFEFY